ncbi:DUF1275 family protein [Larsenimonas rhizosphaerae]|uniref:YoaK family protein n=1 Tax=Larsenimonas rhizosphaerae TaxID=2944682 RepID=A0AA41ZNJ0_9GAMM|nr:YoaK family protein [Larsenimonas rhizosphaerae]MCM2129534.1 DUF1275 family protein [Larsenimonas rhizosphaerae]MCX2524190.1 YoaK family protein [Larsenimonas rhizosphaerae]
MPRKLIPLQAFALLFMVAGATDALIYRHSRDLLAVYMTGNTSHVGQHLALGDGAGTLPLLGVIATFFFATTAGAWLGDRAGLWRATLIMLLTATLVTAAWALAETRGYSYRTVLCIAAGMGMLNQVSARESGVTFLTGMLVRTGRAVASGHFREVFTGLMRWMAMIAGAAIATVLDERYGEHSLLFIIGALIAGAMMTTGYVMAIRADTAKAEAGR